MKQYKCRVHGLIPEHGTIKFEPEFLKPKDAELVTGVYCMACLIEQARCTWGIPKLEAVKEE